MREILPLLALAGVRGEVQVLGEVGEVQVELGRVLMLGLGRVQVRLGRVLARVLVARLLLLLLLLSRYIKWRILTTAINHHCQTSPL